MPTQECRQAADDARGTAVLAFWIAVGIGVAISIPFFRQHRRKKRAMTG